VSTRTDGMGGLPFANDLVKHLGDNWTCNGGKKPNFTTQWKVKALGVGTKGYDEVIISLDSENPKIFSMISGIGADGKWNYDWLHEISVTIDIYSSVSEARVLQLVDECVRILKNNVVTTINGREYIQMLPSNITSLNEEFRNIYRYTIDVDTLRYNP